MKNKINSLLLFLIVLDFLLAGLCLLHPPLWVKLIHGVPYEDTLGVTRRQGAVWAAFFLFQVIALKRWQTEPQWLAVVAGIRLTELFSDWVYLFFAQSLTLFGKIGLFIAPPVNLWVGYYLLKCYRQILQSSNTPP